MRPILLWLMLSPPCHAQYVPVDWQKPVVYFEYICWPVERLAPRSAQYLACLHTERDGQPCRLVIYNSETIDGQPYQRLELVHDDGRGDSVYDASFACNGYVQCEDKYLHDNKPNRCDGHSGEPVDWSRPIEVVERIGEGRERHCPARWLARIREVTEQAPENVVLYQYERDGRTITTYMMCYDDGSEMFWSSSRRVVSSDSRLLAGR